MGQILNRGIWKIYDEKKFDEVHKSETRKISFRKKRITENREQNKIHTKVTNCRNHIENEGIGTKPSEEKYWHNSTSLPLVLALSKQTGEFV